MVNAFSNQHWRGKAPVIAVLLGIMVIATVAFAQGPATIRPIENFVNAQDTYCFDCIFQEFFPGSECVDGCLVLIPPLPNLVGFFDPDAVRLAVVDIAGLVNKWIEQASGGDMSFGTEMRGTVIERPLEDGRAEVHVILKTTNAFAWVVEDIEDGALLFGNYAPEVLNEGKEPALGESFFELKFINNAPPGGPLPDLVQLVFFTEPDQELLFIALRTRARGELHEAFGVPEGTSGRATVVQTGLFMTGFHGAVADGFPVERVDLKAVGK